MGQALRRVFVARFPYFVLYAPDDAPMEIVTVAHFRRRPGYWRDRQ